MSMSIPSDVPTLDHYLHSFVAMIRGSVKPNVYTAKNRQDVEDIYRIGVAVAGGEEALREKIISLAVEVYKAKEEVVGAQVLRNFEKSVMLQTLDTLWKEHLAAMDTAPLPDELLEPPQEFAPVDRME